MNDAAREPGEQPGLEVPPDRSSAADGSGGPAESFTGYGAGSPNGVEPGAVGYGMQPYRPAGRRSHWPRQVEIRWAVAVVVVLALVGIGAGALWIGVAPRQSFLVVKAGQAVRVGSEGEVYVADDAWYFFITLVIGLLAGVLAWLPRSGRGVLMPVALAAGGIAGALATWAFGEWLTPHVGREALQRVGETLLFQVQLKAQAAVVTEAFAAVVVYLILAGFAERDDLGNPDGSAAAPVRTWPEPDRFGPDRLGPERSGPDRLGPQRLGPERPGSERSGPERSGPERSGPERSGPERLGPEES
jgi:hypothetical protein